MEDDNKHGHKEHSLEGRIWEGVGGGRQSCSELVPRGRA